MAATLTPSKITDFFPPSPKIDSVENENEDFKSDKHEQNGEESKQDRYLLTSSLVMTPKSSPVKEDEETNKDETEAPEQPPVKETTCKKSLEESLKKEEVEEIKPSKQKKKRNRRKNNKTDTKQEVSAGVITNGPGRPKTARKKTTNTDSVQKNKLVTDFFPVRRSERKSKTEIEKEKVEDLHYKILNKVEDGLKVVELENKGRGVIATKDFLRNDFVVEYVGDLINLTEAKQREDKYGKDPTKGCYMYYFNFKGKSYCIDATEESGKLGRLLNHSRTSGNCYTKLIDVKGNPYLILAASRDIKSGEELLYDYGDRSKAALESHPWLKA